MPYGHRPHQSICPMCRFNPSYGLHALRAVEPIWGLRLMFMFQSLIWVACPTGTAILARTPGLRWVSIPHMGCMPYGLADTTSAQSLGVVSIPHMGCMPYGLGYQPTAPTRRVGFQSLIWVACPTGWERGIAVDSPRECFNPSYGLHALRA